MEKGLSLESGAASNMGEVYVGWGPGRQTVRTQTD